MIDFLYCAVCYGLIGSVGLAVLVALAYLWGAGIPALKRAYQGAVPPGAGEQPTPLLDLVLFVGVVLSIAAGLAGLVAATFALGAL